MKRHVERMLERLRSADPQTREEAAWRLSRWGGEGTVPALTEALWDSSPGVRVAASEALCAIGTPEAVRALIDAATRPDQPDPEFWLWLDELGDEAVLPLIDAVRHGVSPPDDHLTRLLASLPSAAPRLVELLDPQEPDWIRSWALECLARMDRPPVEAVDAVWRCLRGVAQPPTRAAAARLIPSLLEGPANVLACAIELMADGDPRVRAAGVRALDALPGDHPVPRLRRRLSDPDPLVRAEAASCLASRHPDEDLVPVLVNAAAEGPVEALLAAHAGLERLRRADALIDILRERWVVSDDPVARVAAAACLRARDARSVSLLVQLLEDPHQGVVREAIDALAAHGPRAGEAVEALIRIVTEGGTLAAGAARALGRIGHSSATEPLISVLNSGKPHLARVAATALAEIGDLAAIEPLAAAASSASEEVAQRAAEALSTYGPVACAAAPMLLKALREHQDDREEAVMEALCAIGPALVPALLELLGDERSPAHAAAVRVLARMGSPAVPHLVEALDLRDPVVASRAAWLLGCMGPVACEAAPRLSELLQDGDPKVRVNGAVALSRLGCPEEARVTLEELRNHRDLTVRSTARAALRELVGTDDRP